MIKKNNLSFLILKYVHFLINFVLNFFIFLKHLFNFSPYYFLQLLFLFFILKFLILHFFKYLVFIANYYYYIISIKIILSNKFY